MKILITTCSKRLAQAKYIKEMMAKCPYEWYFVYGRGNDKMLEPYITVDMDDSYEQLPLKTFSLIEHFVQNWPKEEKLVKMDDDTWVDFEKLKRYENAPEDYIGLFQKYEGGEYNSIFHWYKITSPEFRVPKANFTLSYADGALYILSRNACFTILSKGRHVYHNTPTTYQGEDVKVGMALTDPSITRRDIKFLNHQLNFELFEDFMAVHPVNFLTIKKLNELTTNRQKMDFLTKFNCLSENTLRLNQLRQISSSMTAN